MDAKEFLDLAGRLSLGRVAGPAEFRTAISRTYYGVYHLARRILTDELRFVCRDDNEHRWVQRHFYNCQMQSAKDVGRLLGNLHEARKSADYELSNVAIETAPQARFQLERAAEIQSRLQSCASNANLELLRAEMIAYRTRANVQ
jgi:hypothetical protein